MSEFTPTAEQQDALEKFATGRSLVIEAGAGTGKTSTLRLLAQSTPRKGQYIAFNKAIVVEAESKMPGTVNCSTAHSLAYRAVGKQFGTRLRTSQRMRAHDIARMVGLDAMVVTTEMGRKPLAAGFLAGLANRAISRFCQTADPAPTAKHVPYVDGIDLPHSDGRRRYENNDLVAAAVADVLPAMWKDLTDPHGRLPYKHEHYLKAWQLRGPKIDADYILFDEAQDANPVMRAIVMAQTHAQIVWVGDSQQQIYAWNGAVNALAAVEGAERSFLSQSFRFGPEVAGVANIVLGWLDAELRLVGSPDIASVVAEVAEPDAILCRTNAKALDTLLGHQASGYKVHLVGGGKDIVDFAKGARDLMAGRKSYLADLACFDTWSEVTEYVRNDAEGSDLRMLVQLVEEYGVDVILAALGNMVPEAAADVVVSTAHRAKGREWNSVQLAEDLGSKPEEGLPGEDELRLLYVAATRARLELDVSAVQLLVAK